jgi:DNA-binding transcriptional LysR family regulator
MLDVRRLKVLREVARLGSFSAAAEALSFTQPAISRQIATLEAETGTKLVDRGSRGIHLTPAGELLVEHADAILDRLALAEAQLEALSGLEGGRLRLGSFATANATLIPLALRRFTDDYPNVELDLREALSRELIDQLAAGDLDLAVVGASHEHPDIVLEPLMTDPLFVALPSDHALAGKRDLSMADLRHETWIEGRDKTAAQPLITAANAAGFEPRIRFESTQWLGKQGLVAAGVGVTLIPQLALATVRDDIELRSLHGGIPDREIFLATTCCGYRAPAVTPMRAILKQVADEHRFECDAMVDAALVTSGA